jgi:anti-sigma factor RsiW
MPDDDRDTTHLSAERLASYLDGTLTPAERDAALAHFDDCADCRREMTETRRVIALSSSAASRSQGPIGRRVGVRSLVTAAIAAALVFAVVPTLMRNRSGPVASIRGPDRVPQSEIVPELATVSPAKDGTIAPSTDAFVWRAASGDAEYRLTIMDATGGVVWRKSTSDTSVMLPGDLRLTSGNEYFWSVDALLADGHSTTTHVNHFSVR